MPDIHPEEASDIEAPWRPAVCRTDLRNTSSKHLIIEGSRIMDIPSFYEEINRVFMADEDWKLGISLDALNDLLHGGFGAAACASEVIITWRDAHRTRDALGVEATLTFLRARGGHRSQFAGAPLTDQIKALKAGHGRTYFDIVMEVFSEHPSIQIVPA